jgi:ferredoxin-NADP reductase
VLTFTREHQPEEQGRRIDADFLEAHLGDRDGYCYVCGPDAFVTDVKEALSSLGVPSDRLVYER